MDFVDSLGDAMLAEGNAPEVGDQPATQPTPEQAPPEPAPQPEPQPEPEAPPQGGHIPIQALLDEREKRQEAARRAEAAERRVAEIERANQAPVQRPDLYDDPDAFAADLQRQQAEAMFRTTAQVSARFAQKEFGEDTVKAAVDWAGAQNDQYLHQRFMASDDPYGLLVAEYNRDQMLSKIGNDPDAYVRQRAAELGLIGSQQQPGAQAPIPQSPAPKPAVRSLATQPSAGGGPAPVDAGFENLGFNLDRKRG